MEWVLIAMLPTFACDTAAYFIGKKFGKHKLIPRVSPNKTWEGAIAGFLAAIGITVLFAFIFLSISDTFALSFANAIVLGCAIGVIAQLGTYYALELSVLPE